MDHQPTKGSSQQQQQAAGAAGPSDFKRPDKVHPYRLNFWLDVIGEDSTSEMMNVLGMIFSMVGILLKYKTCAWLGLLVAAVSYANVRSSHDGKQIMSTFMLSLSSVVMCYLTNPQPISHYLASTAAAAAAGGSAQASAPLDMSAPSGGGQ